MPRRMSFTPSMNVSSARSRSLLSDAAGMTRSQRSFQTLRPTSRVELNAGPARSVEWRRIVPMPMPSAPARDENQPSSSSCVEPIAYGSGITWSTTFHFSTSRSSVPAGARM